MLISPILKILNTNKKDENNEKSSFPHGAVQLSVMCQEN